jgi:endonuclease/exonuclease/phosphatase family metal-dependent hydrolase
LKLVSYNIQYGFGLDGAYDLARAAASVADADIIALQEVERHWPRSNFDDQPEIIARLLPEHHWVYGPAFDMDGSLRDADGRLVNRRRQFGTMLLSRWPIVWSRLHLLPMRKMTHRLNTQNPALECMIRTPAGPLRVFSLHLAHIDAGERLEQIDFLLGRHRRIADEGGPWSGSDDEPHRNWSNGEPEPEAPQDAVWMGDFNMLPGSAEYRRIIGGGFVDAAVAAGHAADGFYTHERMFEGRLQRRRLDYCFVTEGLAGRVRGLSVETENRASDHFPVTVVMSLR